jgi:hypothetical protein
MCETWSPTLREEHRLKVSENRVLRRDFFSARVKGCKSKNYNQSMTDAIYIYNTSNLAKSSISAFSSCLNRITIF